MRKRCWKTVLSAILASAMLFTSVPTNLSMTVHAQEPGVGDTLSVLTELDDENEPTQDDQNDENKLAQDDQTGQGSDEDQNAKNLVGGGTNVVNTTEDEGGDDTGSDQTPDVTPDNNDTPDTNDNNGGNGGQITPKANATTGAVVNDDKTVTFTCVASEITFKNWKQSGAVVTTENLSSVWVKGGTGDWGKIADLTKGENDVWTGTTTSALSPGTYNWKFFSGDVTNDNICEEGGNRTFRILAEGEVPVVSPVINGKNVTFSYKNDNATDVKLAGSMTDWGTNSKQMVKDDEGVWKVTLEDLAPGNYQYKFIVTVGDNTDWIADPSNDRVEGNDNNTAFTIAGLGDAAINATANKTTDLPAELDTYYAEDGTKSSKAVTYTLTEDATQKNVTLGGTGGQQTVTVPSTLSVGDKFTLTATANDSSDSCTVTVTVVSAGASAITGPVIGNGQVTFYFQDNNYELVKVKGDMTPNDWKTIPMEYDSETGFWTLTCDVLPGTYNYGFETFAKGETDLKKQGDWATDPLNTENNASKVTVTEAPERTSPKIEGKTVTFSYRAKTAEKVFIAGNMNGFDTSMSEESEYKLTQNKSTDYWELTREMSAGSYEYKIIADFGLGITWLRDPLNPNKTDGRDPNSTFVIEGLADDEITMNRHNAKAELAAKLNLFDETGTPSEVAVTYDKSDETKNAAYKDAVKVTTEAGKTYVEITEDFPADVNEFTLTANDGNNHTSKVTVTIVDKTYKYTIYYYDRYPSHMDVKAADLWIWENGGGEGAAYQYTEKVTLHDSDEWLKATVEVPYTDLGIIGRSFDGWVWQDDNRSYVNTEEKEEVTLYYVFGRDLTETYPTNLPAPVKEPDPRFLVVEYTRAAGTADWYFYTWNNGRIDKDYIEEQDADGNPFIPFKDEDGDGTGTAIVPIGPWNESVSFCLEKKADGAHWAEKDGGDHMCTLPLDQTVVKIRMVEGQGITYVYPYNSGYEIDVPEKKIHFYYRDDEAFLQGSESGHASAQLEIRVKDAEGKLGEAETKDMVYDEDDIDDDPEQQRYEYDVEDLQAATYYYRYVLKDDEGATTYVLDKFNEETEKIDGTEYSVCKYELYDVELQASMQNDSMDYNDNNVLTLTVKAKDSEPAQQADEAQGEKNKLPAGFEVSKASVDLSAIGGSSEAEIDPELLQRSIAVKSSIGTGTKTLPVTLYDQYNNVYETEAKVNVTSRTNSSHVSDDFDWDEAVIYFAVTDRFFDGNAGNNEGSAPGSYDKTTNNGSNSSYHGGDFAGLTQKLDYLQDLGVNTIWITPIVENQTTANKVDNSTVTQAWGYHGYWAKDFTKLDSHLGTEAEFKALLDAAHAKGMKVMVDVVLNHSGYGDDVTGYFNTNFKNKDGETIQMLRGTDEIVSGSDQQSSLSGLPDFRTEDPEVRELLVEWQSNWVSKYPIDYYRVDTVKHVDNTTWSAFKNALTEIDPDFKMIGEWAGAGYGTDTGLLNSGRMDSLLDFDFNDQAATFVKGDLSSVENFLSARNGAIDNTASLGAFLSSHDENGFVYKLMNPEQGAGKSEEEARNLALVAASLQLTAKGQVVIYYGEEIGVSDGQENYPYNTNRNDFDWSAVSDDNKTLAHYKTMLAIRNKYSDVLAKGSRATVVADNERGLDVFTRSYGGTTLIVALNIRDTAQEYVLSGQNPGAVFYDNYNGAQYVADTNGNVVITVPAVADGGTAVLGTEQGVQGDVNVPATMQVRSIPDQTYTGMSIKLSEDVLQVYHGTTKLTAGVDYSVSYKNNKAIGTATVTIKGKGNYKDSQTVQFNIIPKNIADDDVVITYNEYVKANGRELKPLSKITYNRKKLTTKEYQVAYYKVENGQRTQTALKGVKEIGEYQMVLTGLKNYTGEVTKNIFVVETGNFMNTMKITLKHEDMTNNSIVYTGTAIEPTVEVKDKDGNEVVSENYKVSYSNNTDVGTADVIITGLSAKGYYGSVTKTFKITGKALSSVAKVNTTGWQSKVAIDPISGKAEQTDASLASKRSSDPAPTKGTDYEVIYSNNTKPGTATVTFEGKGLYKGSSLKKTFKVTAVAWTMADLDNKTMSVIVNKTAPFSKKGAQPAVTVTYKNKRLTAGKDYKVTYNNNKAVTTATTRKKPTVTIAGMGMFSGTLKNVKEFTIEKADLNAAGITLTVADAVYTDQNGSFISKPVVKEADGTILAEGTNKDYTVAYFAMENGKWEPKTSSDPKLDTNTRMKVVVTGAGNYTGEVSKEYRVVAASIRKATIIAKAQTYTGKEITLDANDFSKAKIGKTTLVYGEDYEIVPGSYEKNVNKGNATVTIRGIGNYGDEKKVTFRITSSVMRWWWNLFS